MTYDEYLKTEHWKAKRAEALDYYGGACILCSSTNKLNVHHRHYNTLWHEDVQTDLSVLCEQHHHIYHDDDKPEIILEPVRETEFNLTETLFMMLTESWRK